jgi:hypothetical protein
VTVRTAPIQIPSIAGSRKKATTVTPDLRPIGHSRTPRESAAYRDKYLGISDIRLEENEGRDLGRSQFRQIRSDPPLVAHAKLARGDVARAPQ